MGYTAGGSIVIGDFNSVALSRDEKVVFTVGQERMLTVWDLRKQNFVAQVDLGHGGEGKSIAVANTMDNVLATGGTDQLVKLWDRRTLRCLSVGTGHSGTITEVRYSPDDKQLVSVGQDGCVLVWNMYTMDQNLKM